MPFQVIRQDITTLKVDAIVNSANPSPAIGGGVDGAIHLAGGPLLVEARLALGNISAGEAKITPGFLLPSKYVIHSVGPVWRGGKENESELLRKTYLSSLKLAEANHCESIAFPLISSGIFGYPIESAIQIAETAILDFLNEHDMMVYLVIFSRRAFLVSKERQDSITAFIDDRYVDAYERMHPRFHGNASQLSISKPAGGSERDSEIRQEATFPHPREEIKSEIEIRLGETFSVALSRMIEERGMKPSEAYKKANVDRRLFAKIQGNIHYQPSKTTAIAFAIALRLNLPETIALIGKAGYALSDSNKFDLIIEYHIRNRIYDVYEINQALFHFDQPLLGSFPLDETD